MAETHKKDKSAAEYVVYSYDKTAPRTRQAAHWERHKSFGDYTKAHQYARKLYDSDRYSKVDIKKLYFDRHRQKQAWKTVKIISQPPLWASRSATATIAFALTAALCGGVLYLIF